MINNTEKKATRITTLFDKDSKRVGNEDMVICMAVMMKGIRSR